MKFKRWLNLMRALDIPDNEATFNVLVTAYSEKHRAYHNSQHISMVLKHLDEVCILTRNPHQIELALWFHDAVYQPFSPDNEIKSAEWAETFLKKNKIPDKFITKVVFFSSL